MISDPGTARETDFGDSPEDWARRWSVEFVGARKALDAWHAQGTRIINRFRDKRDDINADSTRWNLFSSNVQTMRAMMYGQTPRASVSRRFADATDDVARIASEMLERMLNTDIERDSDSYRQSLAYALDDRLLPGLGQCRVRYVARFEEVTVEARTDPMTGAELAAAYTETRKVNEDVETDYIHWKDQLWSPSRVFHELRWWAYRVQMTRPELVKRFGEDIGERVPLGASQTDRYASDSVRKEDPWSRADVWEVWDKEHKKVFWYAEGFDRILDAKDDPLGLEGFWPCPKPMVANATTDAFLPLPDFVLAQDLYNEIDAVSSRITLLERAIRVAGVYDKTNTSLASLLTNSTRNELIPADNWAMFSEKGGIRGAVDWLPLDQIVGALNALRDYRRELMDALYQITGMSDIMRGQATAPGVTATEQRIKASFGSVRMQALQDEFARFASDLQRLKAEIIAKHFDPQTIIQRSNVAMTADASLAEQAVALIKEGSAYRVEVKPEAVSLTDFAALRSERSEVLTAIASFFQAVGPMMTPPTTPFFLQILQWMVAGVRGASTMEGILDQAIAKAQQAAEQAANAPPQQAPPDPRILATQIKAQADLQKEEMKLKADLTRIQAETQAHAQQEQSQAMWNSREAMNKALIQRSMKPPVDPFGRDIP